MRLLSESGGVRTTVLDESMQRSPVFVFDNALEARQFGEWVRDHLDDVWSGPSRRPVSAS